MMDTISRHWIEETKESMRAHALFCTLVDNDTDRLILRALGVTLGPRPVEHSKNVPTEGM